MRHDSRSSTKRRDGVASAACRRAGWIWCLLPALAFFALCSGNAYAGAFKSVVVESEPVRLDKPWEFKLALPGWMPGIYGDAGVYGITTDVSVGFDELLRHTDFVAAMALEVRGGDFGVVGGFLYLAASDGIGSDGLVSKLDFQVDQYLADLALSWRVIDGPRGWLELLVGTRYVNLYQRLDIQGNDGAADRASERLVGGIGSLIRDRVSDRLGEGEFRGDLRAAVGERIISRLDVLEGRDPPLPVGPLGGRLRERLRERLVKIIEDRVREIRSRLRREARLTAVEVRRAVAEAREELEEDISRALKRALNGSASKSNDWFDPYVGLRGRYQFTEKLYATARGDIGGFGIGSDLTWQAYGALGYEFSQTVFAEVGYRYLYIDYRDDGLIYDVATRGFQVTVGITF